LDLHYLKLFNALASELSYSKAADSLFISQPAVSMQIKKLENELGFKLFERIGKNLHLNESGKLLYQYTSQIFSLVSEAKAKMYTQNGIVRGNLMIGASNTPGTYILPRILGEFKELYPEVNTRMHVANTYEIERMIFENKADFAINGGPCASHQQIVVDKLTTEDIVLISSPRNNLSTYEYVEPYQLGKAKFIAHEENSQLYKLLTNILEELSLPVNISMALGNIEAIKQAVAWDLGIAAIPRSAITIEVKLGLLKVLKLKDYSWSYNYSLLYHKNKHITPSAEKLIQLIRERMGTLEYA
jgi:DNA-binding transcriptional LysR family regulator